MGTSGPGFDFPNWARWSMRAVLLGFGLAAAAFALVAWFGEPPIATSLLYAGVIVAGAGVVAGTIGVLVSGRWKGNGDV